jgi:branched-chain amino acid transport system substrate-binding protein
MTHLSRRAVLAATAVASALPILRRARAQQGPVKLGCILPLSGPSSVAGSEIVMGVRLAHEEANAKGGLFGAPIQLITEDDEGLPTKGTTAARKLIESDGVCAISATYVSGVALAIRRVAAAAKIPVVSAGSTSVTVTDANTPGDPWFFRAFPGSDEQGDQSATDIVRKLKGKHIALVYENSSYGKSLAEKVRAVVTAAGAAIVAEDNYNGGEQDFSAMLARLRALNPDTVYLGGLIGEGSAIVRQAHEIGFTPQFVGSGSMMTDKFIELTGAASEGFAVSSMFEPSTPNPAGHAFAERFRVRYKSDADVLSALGYDSMNIIIEAVRRAGKPDGQAVHDALMHMADFPLVQGPPGTTAKFDAKGGVSFRIGLAVVHNGHREWLPFD